MSESHIACRYSNFAGAPNTSMEDCIGLLTLDVPIKGTHFTDRGQQNDDDIQRRYIEVDG